MTRCPNCGHQLKFSGQGVFKAKDILKELCVPTVWVDSDGWRGIDAYVNCQPDELFDEERTAVVLAIAEKLPLKVHMLDLDKRIGEVVWIDAEFVSLRYSGEGYNVWKLKELLALRNSRGRSTSMFSSGQLSFTFSESTSETSGDVSESV